MSVYLSVCVCVCMSGCMCMCECAYVSVCICTILFDVVCEHVFVYEWLRCYVLVYLVSMYVVSVSVCVCVRIGVRCALCVDAW